VTGEVAKAITDEMISPRLADALRMRGYDVTSCHGEGRASRGIADQEQLAFATAQGRAIYTFNAVDFRRLHAAWKAAKLGHGGIILPEDLDHDPAEMSRRLRLHLDTLNAVQQHDRIVVLLP
jgi:predicted nuclease of predicted toxin-antitoxin system